MLAGWETQQRARFLEVPATIKPRLDLIRRFARFSNQYPWQWEPPEVEAFMASLSIAPSTARNYQNAIRIFCEFAADALAQRATRRCSKRFTRSGSVGRKRSDLT
jgi:integrase/recombinase XerD